MIEKKNPKADLERKRFAFFQIGLILASAICLAAFEYITPVFTDTNKMAWEQDTVFTYPEIPKEMVYAAKQKVLPKQKIVNEVKLVVKLPLKTVATPLIDHKIDLNFDGLLDLLGDTTPGFVPPNVGAIDTPDVMPKFPGDMGSWIAKNIRLPEGVFPTSGTIIVNFVVDKQGNISDVVIGKGLDSEHDRAALMVVKKMPKWQPGEQMGKPVAVNYNLPIRITNR
ncbi:hypothetical protein DNU06_10525 [Putridiphycobacter roseus]|uniref:TonB C-terminal domain-containing protein n=1 Tax=Putridiphycobacter roseus TaxID=2219161 RepID=A0A2W1MZ42_9FLAO|nr:energy transducer TonB [Putridiphycobacter roseus]PZE17167.1 hypothetical protein DNU06_10525 [Putridiphycobacter roseus]